MRRRRRPAPHNPQDPDRSGRDNGQKRESGPASPQPGRVPIPARVLWMLQQNQAARPLGHTPTRVRGLGSSAALPGPPSPEVSSHSGQTGQEWAVALSGLNRQRKNQDWKQASSLPSWGPTPPRPEARPAPSGHAPPPCCDSRAPLHARVAHGDLAGPQAVAELGGDGDEAGAQAPGGTRLGVDEGLHEAAELVQGVDGANQLRGAHAQVVRGRPPPSAPGFTSDQAPSQQLSSPLCHWGD